MLEDIALELEDIQDEQAELADGLEKLGDSIGVSIRCQHEDIFNKMHRI